EEQCDSSPRTVFAVGADDRGMFGTSGVRGPVGEAVTAGLALDVGRALATDGAATVVVGRDARDSGRMLVRALVAGLTECGAPRRVILLVMLSGALSRALMATYRFMSSKATLNSVCCEGGLPSLGSCCTNPFSQAPSCQAWSSNTPSIEGAFSTLYALYCFFGRYSDWP
ncbi:MAG: hypothetical protein R6U78_15830, partial [Bacteroidales bacterium]